MIDEIVADVARQLAWGQRLLGHARPGALATFALAFLWFAALVVRQLWRIFGRGY